MILPKKSQIMIVKLQWLIDHPGYIKQENMKLAPSNVITDIPLKCAISDSVSEAAFIALTKKMNK